MGFLIFYMPKNADLLSNSGLASLPLCLWIALIFALSSQPYQEQTIQPYLRKHVNEREAKRLLPDVTVRYRTSVIRTAAEPFLFMEFLFRKGAHLFVYAVLAVLAYVALLPCREKRLLWKSPAILLFAALIASLDEWNQLLRPGRTGAIEDVWIDLTGAAFGLLLIYICRFLQRFVRL